MDLSTFIVAVFCLVDDQLKGKRIRQRGPTPKLSDSEVLTIEIVGEFLGLDTDKALYGYFRRHYAQWFPTPLGRSIAHHLRPPSRQPLASQGTPLAGARGRRSSRAHLRHLPLNPLAGVPLRSCLPL